MANETNPQSEAEKELNDIQSRVAEWKSQLNKGLDEARDMYHEQREKLIHWSEEARQKLNETSDNASENWKEIKKDIGYKLDDIRETAAQAKDDSLEALEHQRSVLRDKLDSLRGSINEFVEDSKDEAQDFWAGANRRFENSQQRLDLFRLHFHLAQMDSEETFAERKKQISRNISEFEAKMKVTNKHSKEKLSEIRGELGTAWKNIREIIRK